MEPLEAEPVASKDPENPPQYGSQPSGTGAPPAYGSWLDELKDARRTAANPHDYMKKSGQAVYNNKASLPMMALFLPIPVSQIIVGAININNCQVQPLIPIWMIVAGSVFLAMKAAALIDKCLNKNQQPTNDDDTQGNKFFRLFQSLCSLFTFAWLICGSVWVFSIYRPELDNRASAQYCNRGLYLYAFALLIIAYIGMFFFCCCCGCICCTTKQDKTESSGDQ